MLIGWTSLLITIGTLVIRQVRLGFPSIKIDTSNRLELAAIAFICVCTLVIAAGAEPNNYDAGTYRLPRIEVWIQNSSAEHFFTNNERQIAYPPLAEYILLQTRLLSGGYHFYMIVQWLAMVCSLASVYHITLMLLGAKKLAWFAALFAATLPIGIAESTSVQNDYVAAALLLAFVQTLVSIVKEGDTSQRVALCVFSGSLAGLTKLTAFLVGSGFAVWLGIVLVGRLSVRQLAAAGVLATVVLGLTFGTFVVRNVETFGSALSPVASLTTPAVISLPVIADNIILGIGSNFFMGQEWIDRRVQSGFLQLTSALGTDTQREASMTPETDFAPLPSPIFLFHEDLAPNPLHTLFILVFVGLSIPATSRTQRKDVIVYALCCLVGVVAFNAGVRWQPYITRLQIPIFLVFAPIVAAGLAILRRQWAITVCAVVLFIAALGPLFFNPNRAIFGVPGSFRPFYLQDRPSLFWANVPDLALPYRTAIQWLADHGVRDIGTLSRGNDWEYPLWKYLPREGPTPLRIEPVQIGDQHPARVLGPFRPDAVVGFDADMPETIVVEGYPMRRAVALEGITVYARDGGS